MKVNRLRPHIALAALVLGILAGCSSEPQTPVAYKGWFAAEENGCIKSKTIGNLEFVVQYRPAELMAIDELVHQSAVGTPAVDSVLATYGGSEYFLVRVRPKAELNQHTGDLLQEFAPDYEAYDELAQKLSFELGQHLQLVTAGDTLEPALFHREPTYELGAEQRFLIAFQPEKPATAREMTFIYDDELFRSGRLKFKFDIDKTAIPPLPIPLRS